KRVIGRVFAWLIRRLRGGKRLESAQAVTQQSIDRLVGLRRAGALRFGWVIVTHILYFSTFAGVGVVMMGAFGGAMNVRAFAATMIYIAFCYLAPTPGGAGFAEAMALPFFG